LAIAKAFIKMIDKNIQIWHNYIGVKKMKNPLDLWLIPENLKTK